VSAQLKAIGDSVAIPTAFLAWLKAITIPEAAALAAFVYTALRIGELLYGWYKKWRHHNGR
jgi:hypothetical protein